MAFKWFLVTIATFVFAAVSIRADCGNWDNYADYFVLDPVRQELKNHSLEYFEFFDKLSESFYGVQLDARDGTVGNLSDIKLCRPEGSQSASIMCNESGNMTIQISVGLENVLIAFDYFKLALPLLPDIGDTKLNLALTGNCVTLSLSLLSNKDSECSARLNNFEINSLGRLDINFEEGLYNKAVGKISSAFLNFFDSYLSNQVKLYAGRLAYNVASELVKEEGSLICKMIPMV